MFSKKEKEEKVAPAKDNPVPAAAPVVKPAASAANVALPVSQRPFIATGLPMKGDLSIRPYRKTTDNPRKIKERAAFEAQLTLLSKGYKSTRTLDDMDIKRTLGSGSFGRVLLCTTKENNSVFWALKIISKERVIKTKQVEHTIAEKNILFCMDSCFVVKCMDYFMDKNNLYYALEFISGGEMFTHIQKQKRRRFTEEQTRFFSAETVCAFEYLHNIDIIFRDLKPENMLIDWKGHVRVTDFGFAKRVDDRTWTMCGTPEYLAPEIIVNKGYSHAVDWWAIGVLTYEMRCGHSPFEANSQMEMFEKITRADFKFPRDFTEEEIDLITGLLQVDLTRRLGNMHGGADDVKKRRYFKDINWDRLILQQEISPYIPMVNGPGDASNFDTYPEEKNQWVPGTDKFGDQFQGF